MRWLVLGFVVGRRSSDIDGQQVHIRTYILKVGIYVGTYVRASLSISRSFMFCFLSCLLQDIR